MITTILPPPRTPHPAAHRIVIVNEDGRQSAAGSPFAGQGLSELAGDVHWCSFAQLRDSGRAEQAAHCAATAHLILFAVTSQGDFPAEVKSWIESWVGKRNRREGTLVGLITDRPSGLRGTSSLKELYLRHTARRAGMDYLSHLPARFGESMPNSLDSYGERAEQVTAVLDQILRTHLPPTPPP